jgi:drug/metabolite transporter (DMT)-like permease
VGLTEQRQGRAWLALFAVYFFWGTTYLGIRMALESFPALTLISLRFLLSGSILLAFAAWKSFHLPRGRELLRTSSYGLLLLGGGNGALVFAQQWIPSGLAALFVTTGPFWMVGLDAVMPGGERLRLPTVAGILVGFCGVLLLVAPAAENSTASSAVVRAFLVLQFGAFCWSFGSLLQRRNQTRAHPVISGAVQQLAVGLAFLPAALLVPQPAADVSLRGVLALAYLVTFGSLVGYSAYVYAMQHLPVSIVATYTYVNPVVAVTLGWLFYREPVGPREIGAMCAVFAGVAIVKRFAPAPASNRQVAKA